MLANAAARPARGGSVGQLAAGTWTLGLGGFLFSMGNLLHPLEHNDAAYRSATWIAAHLIMFASLPLLMLGLPVLRRGLRRHGQASLAGAVVVLAVVGLVGMAPALLVEAFIAPEVGHAAMEHFEATGFGVVSGLLPIAWIASSALLALACQRARFGPAWARILLAGATVGLLFAGVPGPIGGVFIILATAAYGVAIATLGWELRHS